MVSPIYNIRECKYISNVGLFLSCDESNIVTYNRDSVEHEFHKLQYRPNMVIAVKMEHIRLFLNYMNNIQYPYILATFDCDYTMPFDLLQAEEFYKIIEEPKLIHWYSVNALDYIHDKFSVIPLGMNLHSISFSHNVPWSFTTEYMSPVDVENVLINIKNKALPFYRRILKCYSNFHFNMYEKHGRARQTAIEEIPNDVIYYEPTLLPADKAWEEQSKYAFVVSPHGNGLDCHRTWEALILGCIVIVKTSPLDSLYTDLPVIIIKDWHEITREMLDTVANEFKTKTFNYDKLTVAYWKTHIFMQT